MLQQADLLCKAISCPRFQPSGATPQNVVERIGVIGRPGGLCSDQFDAERVREPVRDFILCGEQVSYVLVEMLRP